MAEVAGAGGSELFHERQGPGPALLALLALPASLLLALLVAMLAAGKVQPLPAGAAVSVLALLAGLTYVLSRQTVSVTECEMDVRLRAMFRDTIPLSEIHQVDVLPWNPCWHGVAWTWGPAGVCYVINPTQRLLRLSLRSTSASCRARSVCIAMRDPDAAAAAVRDAMAADAESVPDLSDSKP